MNDGVCYIQYSPDTIYAFPDLNCSENVLLPQFTSTTRQVYFLSNGKYILSESSIVTDYTDSYSQYIGHISSGLDRYSIDTNYLILPATLVVLAFFSIIYHWFLRLRG